MSGTCLASLDADGAPDVPPTANLDVPVDDLVLVQVPEPLQDLSGVEDDGGLLQRAPFGAQQRGQASWRKEEKECPKPIMKREDDQAVRETAQ